MTGVMRTEDLLEENNMDVYLDVWDFVDVLNESNPPVCYGGREYGYGYDLKGNEPDKFEEMFKEWAKNRSN